MPARLHLVGVIHRDPRGHARLLALLRSLGLGPEEALVSLEVSPLSLAFRRRYGPFLTRRLALSLAELAAEGGLAPDELWRRPEVAGLVRFLWPPFEFTAARAWAGPGRLRLAEPNSSSLVELPRAWELVGKANLRGLLAEAGPPLGARVMAAYLRAARVLASSPPAPGRAAGREDRLAAFIARLASTGRTIVHVGGWEHLPGLRSRLSGLEPACRLAGPEA